MVRQGGGELSGRQGRARVGFEVYRQFAQRDIFQSQFAATADRIHRSLALPAQLAAERRIGAEGVTIVLVGQGAEISQRKINRGKTVGITDPAVAQFQLALFQREAPDDQARKAGVGGSFTRPALKRTQQFGQIEFAVRRDRKARARRGNTDFGKAPGAPDQGSPLQLHGKLADCE